MTTEKMQAFLNQDLLTKADQLSIREGLLKDNYGKQLSYANVTSYSSLQTLHRCPRLFLLEKAKHANGIPLPPPFPNIDFIFGHSVAAGVQNYFLTGDFNSAIFATYLGWTGGFDFTDFGLKKKKSLPFAVIAVMKFITFWRESGNEEDYELYYFTNSQGEKVPGIEPSINLDCGNTFRHYLHIDAVLRNKVTNELTVVELKTTSYLTVDEALYANSSQAIGYGTVLDKIASEFNHSPNYTVLYLVYTTTGGEWNPLPFKKTKTEKVEWLQDILLDQATINTYIELDFFPKRGENCVKFNKRCEHFGSCDLPLTRFGLSKPSELPRLEKVEDEKPSDFKLNVATLFIKETEK